MKIREALLLKAVVLVVLFALVYPVKAVVFTNDTVITPLDTTYDGADVVVSNCVLTVDGPHSFASVRIASGATLTHTAGDNGELAITASIADEPQTLVGTNAVSLARSNILTTSVIVTDPGGTILFTNHLDYQLASADGQTLLQRTETSAIADGATVRVSYDHALGTTNSGLTLLVAGDLEVESGGSIRADGRGFGGNLGPGNGGQIGNFTGAGGGHGGFGGNSSSNAVGGNCYGVFDQPTSLGSGGGQGVGGIGGAGGGAIKLDIVGSATINGLITANGADATNNRSGGGSGGSIWITAQTVSGTGTITAHGGAGEPVHGGGGGGGRIALHFGVDDFTGTSAAYGGNGSKIGGAGTVYTKLTDQNGLLLVDNGGRAGTNSLIALTNGADILIRGNAAVLSSGDWFARDVTIQADSAISADATGSPAGTGIGRGTFSSTDTSTRPCSGGGHGGYGAMASTNVPGGDAYGVLESPTALGSGGGSWFPVSIGGAGGGAIRMTVSGTLWVEGRLSANGGNGSGSGGGGGAGGSVLLTAGTLAGDGLITANGGAGAGTRGGGGGGGRIAIFSGTNLFTGTLGAFGGGGANWAGAGTVFIQTNQAGGQLILDNNSHLGTNTPFASAPFMDLTVREGAIGQSITSLSCQNLLLASNGWLTVRTQSTPMTLNLTISGNATIHPGGGIQMNARGSGQNSGLGAGRFNNNIAGVPGSGGGHGGFGGSSVGGYAPGGNSYNSSTTPSAPGSGGGGFTTSGANASYGGVGGGALRLTVNGTLNVEGSISANGGNGAGLGGGGGSGGSIWLTIGTLTGNGSITANGGHGVGSIGGGGGGGRISITLDTNSFAGSITAYGGGGANWGGAGTIFWRTNSQPYPFVLLDNGGNFGTNTTFDSASAVDLSAQNGAIGQWSPSQNWTVRNLFVSSNAMVSPSVSSTMRTLTVTGDAVVEAGGAISADGKGLNVTGAGFGDTFVGARGGGGHGGWGGANPTRWGAAYGSATSPSFPGSQGGGGSFQNPPGGSGGGALRLIVMGTLTVNGRISANGTDGGLNGGGGSGGSLWITTSASLGPLPVFTGNGVISANGGAGYGQGGGGGGGRISITYGSNSFTGTYSATGGPGLVGGGAGTIHTKAVNAPVGQLLLDNGGLSGTHTPMATTNGLPTVPFNLTISRRASVLPLTPLPLLSSLHLTAGAMLTMRTDETNLVVNVLHDLEISEDSAIAVDGKGFSRTNGTGAGRSLSNQGGGGGYGGDGGTSASGAAGGTNYGSLTQPVHRGSGGGAGSGPFAGGSEGGGAIRLTVGGTLTVNGRLGANGNGGLQDDSGGGSGGSLWLTAGAITGAGLINADGGPGELFSGGGGGGGRIAIYSPMNTFTGLVSAAGGAGWTAGGTGTVFQSTSLGAFAVISNSPSGVVSNGVNGMDFALTSQISLLTAGNSNVTLQVPPGALAVTNLTFSNVSPTTLRVSFPFQTTPGDYWLRLGPGIEDFFGQPLSQVYTGAFTIMLPTIQGVVTNANGQPVAGVAVRLNGLESGAVTDASGNYLVGYVPPGYLTLVPTLAGHAIVPASRTYWELTNQIVNQDFLMVDTVAPEVSAVPGGTNIVVKWHGLAGVRYSAAVSTNLVDWWSFGLALDGTNGLMELLVPMDDAPRKFLRVWANY